LPYVSSCPPLKTVRTTFMVYGLAPAVPLRVPTKRPFPFRQLHSAFPVDSLHVRWIPLVRSFRRLGAFAMGKIPRVDSFPVLRLLCPIRLSPRASSFRETFPSHYFPTALRIPRGVSRVHRGGLKRDEVGGVLLCVPSALCGSPGLPEDTQVDLCPLLRCCVCPPHRSLLPDETPSFRFSWLTSQVRSVRGSFARRTKHASGDSPYHLSAKHHLLEAYLLLMIPFRAMLLTPTEWSVELRPNGSLGTCIPNGVTTFLLCTSRRTTQKE
jgi:hypothetical protein